MASSSLAVVFMVCYVTSLACGMAVGPSTGIHKRSVPEPPVGLPPGEISDEKGFHSFRCPFHVKPGSEQELYCVDYLMGCDCMYDDMVIPQRACIMNNKTSYEERVHWQMDIERRRDEMRVSKGQLPQAAPYFSALDCLLQIPGIIAAEEDKN